MVDVGASYNKLSKLASVSFEPVRESTELIMSEGFQVRQIARFHPALDQISSLLLRALSTSLHTTMLYRLSSTQRHPKP